MNTHLFLSLVFPQNKQFGKNLAAGELLSNSHPIHFALREDGAGSTGWEMRP